MGEIEAHESKLYSEFAPLYDKIFGKIFYSRLESVIEDLDIPPGAKVLEVGAGTGTSFPAYPTHCQVTGIDLAPDMLARAQRKIRENGWTHLNVIEMNALELEFPDDSFDYVMAFHVVTVVPDPVRMIAEAKRVCKPGGKIVIVNHFTSDFPLLGTLTEALDPVTRWLGWRTNLRLKPFIKTTDLTVERMYKLSKTSLYTVLHGTKEKNGFHPSREH
ncbi:MAG: methyltransferase domain-containing protein [Deltaproteobacteria bacterium]|jgi:phosphatidylethanolamine/phosphatidyl-N-methylethanolamine N-methyltransferase|nr:methyltransferase domain-containing protein [Deltaproteobacteria bacterium]MBI2182596.1 methyltransferase domain-containing protein [Deltaproteobacteria bacterium]MBI2229709.1 methyltransferase domain-containing protein [Deltaproteobacteria bacterium]MBI2532400.1 methyltransferase domain-containing protein [Deltaproteobacteria bacterium]MBI3064601.1 methyltransferase domain-containing protein [Deltaproteobacteria bacterium]